MQRPRYKPPVYDTAVIRRVSDVTLHSPAQSLQPVLPRQRTIVLSHSPLKLVKECSISERLDHAVAFEGTGAHPHIYGGQLTSGPDAMRNLADAVHFLCTLHGRFPAILDHASRVGAEPSALRWLNDAAKAFAIERQFLAQMTVALGPIPSTAGQARSETAVAAQCRVLDMLSQSERRGCALGAAITLTLEWRTIRVLLDLAAEKLDVAIPDCHLPDLRLTARTADTAASNPAIERAMFFGAEQLLSQHRSLWDLLAARAASRSAR